jgi:hypothetical protein
LSVELLACTIRSGFAGGAVGLVNGQWYPVAPLNVNPVTTAEPMVPFTWPLESTITLAPDPSFICQFASVAADAGAANATTTANAAVNDDPNVFLISVPPPSGCAAVPCPHVVVANPQPARRHGRHDSRRPTRAYNR